MNINPKMFKEKCRLFAFNVAYLVQTSCSESSDMPYLWIMQNKPLLVVLVGPTAVGKTALSIHLACHFGADIISCDSRQFYREMEIGTAKPSQEELETVPHHFINTHSVADDYDAGAFAADVEQLLPSLFQKNDIQFMVGGSGLYVRAVCEGLDQMPEADPAIRKALNRSLDEMGLTPLLEELKMADPAYYDFVDQNNAQRVVRALEVIRATGLPYSNFRKSQPAKVHDHAILKIGLDLDRKLLYERIDQRMDKMITMGLFEEAERLRSYQTFNALQTVGYKEIFDYLDGQYDKEEAVRLLRRNSRRYAKRQMTWFRKDQQIHWFDPDQLEEMSALIHQVRTTGITDQNS